MLNPEVDNIFFITPHDHNYWPCPKPFIKQSGYCTCVVRFSNVPMVLFIYLQFADSRSGFRDKPRAQPVKCI